MLKIFIKKNSVLIKYIIYRLLILIINIHLTFKLKYILLF